jgi:ATP-dependent RNA helicase DHX57
MSDFVQYKKADGFSFAVTLSRVNKKAEHESVRLEPHPPYALPTAIEARHWGATYALYRVSSLKYITCPAPC